MTLCHNSYMANRTNPTFISPADAIPAWMVGDKVRPVDMPVVRTKQPPVQDAARLDFQRTAPLFREAALTEPAIDMLAGSANQTAGSRLSPDHENSDFKFSFHDDIVSETSAKMNIKTPRPSKAPKAPKAPKKADMFVWNQIDGELARRRLSTGWLWRKLGSSRQVINGWKNGETSGRSVPVDRYEPIAKLFGWTVERLTTGKDSEPVIEPPAPTIQPATAPAPARPPMLTPKGDEANYSPMALDLAGMFDAIRDDQQKRRAYALIVQMLVMSNPPSPDASAPGAPQTPALHHHR